MNEQEVFRYVDQSLDRRVPNSPLPINDLLRDGKAAQRRKSRRSVIGAAALTVLAIGAGAVVQQAIAGSDGQEPADNIASVDVPKAPEGMRLVGMGRVVVAVPDVWGTEQTTCGQPTEDTVYFNKNGLDCLVDQSDISSLLLVALDSFDGQAVTGGLALTARRLNGVDVLMGDSCPPNAACIYPSGTVLVVPSADVAMRVSGPMDEQPLLKQIVDSLRMLPDGYVAVPFVVGRPNGPVGNQLLGLGLVPDVVDIGPGMSGRATVTSTSPEAGSVVRVGETVHVSVNETAVCGTFFRGICITDPLVDLPTSEWEPGDGGDQALLGGEVGSEDGCLVLFGRDGSVIDVVWPKGYVARVAADGVITLVDPNGEAVARSGDTVSFGGGFGGRDAYTGDSSCVPKVGSLAFVQSKVT